MVAFAYPPTQTAPSPTQILFIGVIGLGLILLIWIIVSYNRFASLRNLIRESWSNVDVALKRRYDLIPNLVSTVKGYAAHESQLFEDIARARSQAMESLGSIGQQAQNEEELVRAVNRLLVRVEAYPDLKASTHFLELQRELANTEDRIAAARRFYNANVRDFNTLLHSFPSSIVGSAMGLKEEDYFEIDSVAVRQTPVVGV